jgi:phosphatidylglycerophosphate synthase
LRALVFEPSDIKVGGVSLRVRWERLLHGAGVREIAFIDKKTRSLPSDDAALLLRGDTLLDARVVNALVSRTGSVLAVDSRQGDRWVGAARLESRLIARFQYRLLGHVVGAIETLREECARLDIATLEEYVPKLRRRVPLYWVEIHTSDDARRAETILIKSSEKDPSDLIAKFVHRPIENWAVARLAHTPITPNQLTLLVNTLAWLATLLFATGQLLAASILTFLVGVLDGMDGKLARLTGFTTRVGQLEHAFDLLFEFSWIVALGYFLSSSEGPGPLLLAGVIVTLIAFYRAIYDRFGQSAGVSLDVYGRVENFFRRIAGRRNLFNLHIFIFVLMGKPLWALYTIFIHAAVTALIYSLRAWVHLRRLDRR